jgi:uncharacterized protein
MEPLTWQDRFERQFEALGHWGFRNRLKVLMVMLLLVVGLASQLRKITIRTASDSFFHKTDPVLIAYNAYRDQFGYDERIIIGIRTADVFADEFLKKLRALHRDLEKNVPYVDDITSLINARNTRGEGNQLLVEDLLEHWPKDQAEFDVVKARALRNPLYKNMLLSEDGTFTTIVIQLDTYSSEGAGSDVLQGFDDEEPPAGKRKYLTNKENSQAVAAVKKAIARHKDPTFAVHLAGSSVVTDTLKRTMRRDMIKFIRLVFATIALFLLIVFRRISGVVLPLLTVVLSVVCTIGLMALTGTPIKMPTQILPSFLLAVGVGASVHLLAIFYQRFDDAGDKEDALAYALGHSGLAIVMTSLTTAAALGSFSLAEIAPIADLGRFAAAGVIISLIFTVVLLPVLLSLCPMRPKQPRADGGKPLMDRILLGTADFSVKHAKAIIAFCLILIVLCVVFACQLRFSHNFLTWFPVSSDIRRSTETIDKTMKGSVSMMVVVDTGQENGLHDPKILRALDELCTDMEAWEGDGYFIGKAWSLPTILKEINRALNENRPEFYTVPANRTLIAQELLLFENSGSDDLEDVVDSQFSKLRVSMKLPWVDAVKYEAIIGRVKDAFEERLGASARITVTGITPLFGRAVSASIHSSAQSYVIAFGAITVMMILLLGSFRVGLLSMIPNILPILVVMAIMVPARMPLDMFTMLVGSIAIGLAVDDTIHFVHNFRRYHQQCGDPQEAVRRTLATTGRAMLTTSIVLSIGFFVYMFATMSNMFNFGLLVGLAIVIALLADFFLAPALMVMITRHEKGKR